MLKKIRCFYWSMRDRGKGKQVIMAAVIVVFGLVIITSLSAKSLVVSRQRMTEVHPETGVSGGAFTGASVSTGSALSAENEPELQVQENEPPQTPVEMAIDASGLDAFHGFMTDDSYIIMEEQIKTECQKRQCRSAKKLNYQQTAEGSFDVASFVLLSDGSILRCDYNMKTDAVSVSRTEYSEADIMAMHNAEMKAEQEALERRQAEDKKKAEQAKKSKKNKSAKKKKSSAKKKSSSGKSAKKKNVKSKGKKK